MNIEVGKAYRTRSGEKVVINEYREDDPYLFFGIVDRTMVSWQGNGQYSLSVPDHHLDLIAEWQEPEPELKIEAGKFYVTRDGRKARVDATDYSGDYPICGGIYDEDVDSERPYSQSWTGGGIVVISEEVSDDIIDLWIDPPRPLEFWGNVYCNDGELYTVAQYDTKEEAESVGDKFDKHYLRTSKFIEVLPQ